MLPIFGFANAGVSFSGMGLNNLVDPITLGIALGLFLGKQVGIFGTIWLAIRAGIARLPQGASWAQVYGMAVLCGIGFTMSLFIGSLAWDHSRFLSGDPPGRARRLPGLRRPRLSVAPNGIAAGDCTAHTAGQSGAHGRALKLRLDYPAALRGNDPLAQRSRAAFNGGCRFCRSAGRSPGNPAPDAAHRRRKPGRPPGVADAGRWRAPSPRSRRGCRR